MRFKGPHKLLGATDSGPMPARFPLGSPQTDHQASAKMIASIGKIVAVSALTMRCDS